MSQFTVYTNNNSATNHHYPYLVKVQNDLLYGLSTAMVIPLVPAAASESFRLTKLNPKVTVNNCSYALMTQDMASISVSDLSEVVADLSSERDAITAAIDLLFFGI